MSITTYAELKTAVALWMARSGDSNITDNVADFITLAENYMNDKLRGRSMVAMVNINPSQANYYVALPTGYMELISFNDDLGDPLQEVGLEEIEDMRYGSSASRPRYFAIGSRIEFDRKAAASRNFPMYYFKRLDIATDTTNDTLTYHPNVYLYGALAEGFAFTRNALADYYQDKFKDMIDSLNERETTNIQKLRTDIPARGKFNIITGQF